MSLMKHGHLLENEWMCEICRNEKSEFEYFMTKGGDKIMKKYWKNVVFGLIFGVFAGVLLFGGQKVQATNDVPWGECVQTACGSSEGTQSREKTHYECPAGYYEVAGKCWKAVPYHPYLIKTDKVAVVETQTQSCTVENPYQCEEEVCPPGTHEAPYEHNELVLWDEQELVCVPDETPVCTENCGTPPTFAGSSTQAPQCPVGSTTNVVANPHVLRNGAEATVNAFITEGDSVHIYWKEVGASNWQHAMSNVKPNADRFVSVVIGGLNANLGYTFGIQQVQGCSGGQTTAVVVDGPETQLFTLSYWE